MKRFTILIIATLLIAFCGCSEGVDNKPDFGVVSSNVTIWEDSEGEYNIILAFEVSNLINAPLYFKESDFDIVDGNGNLIDTIQSVSAYPPVVDPEKTAVYYEAKISDKISDANIKLKAVPHIQAEKSKVKREELFIKGITGWHGKNAIGIVENSSSRTEYDNVHVAIISRTQSNEVVSIMTATIDLIKPGETIEFEAKDLITRINQGIVTTQQNFVYVTP